MTKTFSRTLALCTALGLAQAQGSPQVPIARNHASSASLLGDLHPQDGLAEYGLVRLVPNRVEVRSGASGQTLHTYSDPGAFLGEDVGPAGDVDGDGTPDFFYTGTDRVTRSFANLVSGRTGLVIRALPARAHPIDLDTVQAANLGDTDGDGRPDLGVYVTGLHLPSITSHYTIYSGATGGKLYSSPLPTPTTRLTGVGDLDGDGCDDYLWADRLEGTDVLAFPPVPGEGHVMVFSGRTHSPLHDFQGAPRQGIGDVVAGLSNGFAIGERSEVRLYDRSGSLRSTLSLPTGTFHAIGSAGDITGEGIEDLQAVVTLFSGRREFRLYSGSDFSIVAQTPIDSTDIPSIGPEESFGTPFDVNGDGRPDFLASAPDFTQFVILSGRLASVASAGAGCGDLTPSGQLPTISFGTPEVVPRQGGLFQLSVHGPPLSTAWVLLSRLPNVDPLAIGRCSLFLDLSSILLGLPLVPLDAAGRGTLVFPLPVAPGLEQLPFAVQATFLGASRTTTSQAVNFYVVR